MRQDSWVKFFWSIVVLLVIFTPLFSSCQGNTTEIGVTKGSLAPDFTLTDLDGNQVSLSDFRGKTVFINFWATWCPPCRAEMPEMEAVYQEYKDKGVVILGIDIREPEETVRQFVEQGGYSWTFLLDSSGSVAMDYQIKAIPTSFFLDKKGIIRGVYVNSMTKHQIEEMIIEASK